MALSPSLAFHRFLTTLEGYNCHRGASWGLVGEKTKAHKSAFPCPPCPTRRNTEPSKGQISCVCKYFTDPLLFTASQAPKQPEPAIGLVCRPGMRLPLALVAALLLCGAQLVVCSANQRAIVLEGGADGMAHAEAETMLARGEADEGGAQTPAFLRMARKLLQV